MAFNPSMSLQHGAYSSATVCRNRGNCEMVIWGETSAEWEELPYGVEATMLEMARRNVHMQWKKFRSLFLCFPCCLSNMQLKQCVFMLNIPFSLDKVFIHMDTILKIMIKEQKKNYMKKWNNLSKGIFSYVWLGNRVVVGCTRFPPMLQCHSLSSVG